jgi:ABC-type uncharacterized transport system permease subunit
MNKTGAKLILSIWIAITLSIDLFLSTISFWIVRFSITLNEGGQFRKDTPYAMPIHEVALHQIVISLIALFFGMIWVGIVLIASNRILLLLRFSRPQNSSFNRLSLNLFGLGIIAIALGIASGNINMIYDQIQGRARFDRV